LGAKTAVDGQRSAKALFPWLTAEEKETPIDLPVSGKITTTKYENGLQQSLASYPKLFTSFTFCINTSTVQFTQTENHEVLTLQGYTLIKRFSY